MTNHTANFVPRLSERLKLVASFVPQDSRIADIGTDHGFVPICLAKEGRIKSALAMDVRTGPLERAEAHIKEAGISDIPISTRLSDGLKELKPPRGRHGDHRRNGRRIGDKDSAGGKASMEHDPAFYPFASVRS